MLLSDMLKIVILCCLSAAKATEFQITNNRSGVVWVGNLGNDGKAPLQNGGFVLQAGQTRSIQAPDDWAGRFWARTYCNPIFSRCETGDCGNGLECNGAGGVPPVSLIEITLNGFGGTDYYDISLIEGFNVPISIEPIGGRGDGSQYSCKKSSCPKYLNIDCPRELRLVSPLYGTVGCKSACVAFNTDQYCCRGAYGTPDTCEPSNWPVNYPEYFKSECPDAYSYAYDDSRSTFTCSSPQKYHIVFGI